MSAERSVRQRDAKLWQMRLSAQRDGVGARLRNKVPTHELAAAMTKEARL